MNTFITLLFAVLAPGVLSAAPATSLSDAYQRENSFLTMQKDNLERQQKLGGARHQQRIAELKSELIALERKAVRLTTENDRQFQELQDLQQRRKIESSRDLSLLMTLKKTAARNFEYEKGLKFESASKNDAPEPSVISVAAFADMAGESLALMAQSVATAEFTGAYLDEKGELRQGKIRRHGRGGAHVLEGSELRVLAPDGKGQLRVVDHVKAGGPLLPVYIFESLNQAAVVKKAAGFSERLADAVPALFLLLMFAMVSGLFLVFVRE